MSSTTMNSTTPTEFHRFPELPAELREMVWEEAMPGPLDLQRFNAEIAPHPDHRGSNRPDGLVLCLTPHDDFIWLTSGHRGLLGACRESRWIAAAKIKFYLPINYLARDANGSFAVRFAKVPFNPDGRLCISGLSPALHDAEEGRGARGMELQASHQARDLTRDIQCAAFPEVKNLTICLRWPKGYDKIHLFMLGWDERAFDRMAKKMDKLETVALADEGVLDDRHHMGTEDLERLHAPAPVTRGDDCWDDELDEPADVEIPWSTLYRNFVSSICGFNALKQLRARQTTGSSYVYG